MNDLQNVICSPAFVTSDKFLTVLKYTKQDVLLTTIILPRAVPKAHVFGTRCVVLSKDMFVNSGLYR